MSLEPTSLHHAAAVQRPELVGRLLPVAVGEQPIVLRPTPLEIEQAQHGQPVSDQAGDGRWLPGRPKTDPALPADSVQDGMPADVGVDDSDEPGQQLDVRG